MSTNNKAEQQLISALTRLQGIALDDEKDGALDALIDGQLRERYFSFSIGGRSFAISANCVCEVFVEPAVAVLPNAPELLLGLCNIRGLLVPVYQLHSSLHSDIPSRRTIFCIGKGEQTVGLLIDSLPLSIELPEHRLHHSADASLTALTSLLAGEITDQGKTWLLLNGITIGEQLLQHSLRKPSPLRRESGDLPVYS